MWLDKETKEKKSVKITSLSTTLLEDSFFFGAEKSWGLTEQIALLVIYHFYNKMLLVTLCF